MQSSCLFHLARSLSIAGHPALVMPLTIVGRAYLGSANVSLALWTAALAASAAALAFGYSLLRVRAGAWEHVDASQPKERVQLNRMLVLLLAGCALLAWLRDAPSPVVMGIALSGAVVLCALLLRKQLKLSLHVAFAVFAASLWWPIWPALALAIGLATGVAWSRLVLKRHSRAEVALAVLVGGLCGLIFQYWILP